MNHFKYWDETEAGLESFEIDGNVSTSATVGEGKYKSALFLQLLADVAMADQFEVTAEMREWARAYFGPELCRDAETNPDTKHTAIKALLCSGYTVVTVKRRATAAVN